MQSSQPTEGPMVSAWHNNDAAAALTNAPVDSPTAAVIDTGGRTSVTAECNLSVKGAIAIVYVIARVSVDGGTTWMTARTELVNGPASGDVTLDHARFRVPVAGAAAPFDDTFPVTFKTTGCSHYKLMAYANVADAASRFMIRTKDCGFE